MNLRSDWNDWSKSPKHAPGEDPMMTNLLRRLEKIEASMAPRRVPKPRFRIRFIDPTGEVVGIMRYPQEQQDGETERTKR